MLWSIGWCILDTYNEWQLFPPIEFCLSKPYEFSLKKTLLFLLWDLPADLLLIDCVELSWKLYNLPDKNKSPNLPKLSFNSLVLSSALLIALAALYPALVNFDLDSFAISATFLLLLVDLLKIPFQLMLTFEDNSNTQRQTRETRRQAIMVQEVQERLNNDDQPDFFELEEYDKDKESWSNVYIKTFDEPQPRSNQNVSGEDVPNVPNVKDVPEDTNSDLNLAILFPDPGIQFIDDDVE